MTSNLLCEQLPATELAAPLAIVLQPVMAYTRRPVGYEVTCSLPWGNGAHSVRWNDEHASLNPQPGMVFAACAGDALAIFTMPFSADVDLCIASLPARSLLLLDLPADAPPTDAELRSRCTALKAAGFQIGISRYDGETIWKLALPLVSHIRLRYTRSLLQQEKDWLKGPLRRSVTFIADGVQTEADLASAMQDGFQLFQGAFAHRIARLQWNDTELQMRALLLQRACDDHAITPDLLADALGCGNLPVRFGNLLKGWGATQLNSASTPEAIFTGLGEEGVQQVLQIGLAQEITGCTAPTLLFRLFQLARFHESMRAANLAEPSPDARFEGLILGTLASVHNPAFDNSVVHHATTVLKHRVGLPMDCSAFERNQSIMEAYLQARWDEVERLGLQDGFAWPNVNRLYHEATAWTRAYLRPVLG